MGEQGWQPCLQQVAARASDGSHRRRGPPSMVAWMERTAHRVLATQADH